MELTTKVIKTDSDNRLFMMSKIQNLNGTHNRHPHRVQSNRVVYDVKDTKFEWNSQLYKNLVLPLHRCL